MLSDEQKRQLIQVARQALQTAVAGGQPPVVDTTDPDLAQLRGAFVTLKTQEQLRGCIGYVKPRVSLIQAVADNAQAAALQDPRFPPVTGDELPDIDIEISALTPLEPVPRAEDIEIGRHGLMIRCGMNRGLLLPQVPGEWGWNRDEFLVHTCVKAGLPPDAWQRDDAELLWFEAEVFGEQAQYGAVPFTASRAGTSGHGSWLHRPRRHSRRDPQPPPLPPPTSRRGCPACPIWL